MAAAAKMSNNKPPKQMKKSHRMLCAYMQAMTKTSENTYYKILGRSQKPVEVPEVQFRQEPHDSYTYK